MLFRVKSTDTTAISDEIQSERFEATVEEGEIQVAVPVSDDTTEFELKLAIIYQFCRDGVGGVCRQQTDVWQIPLTIAGDGQDMAIPLPTSPKEDTTGNEEP